MFNELQTGKTTYDVVVPSDYMIQKLRDNKMLHKISSENEAELWENISPYLKDKFENSLEISDYAVPYMWGTVGLMYNPEYYMKRNSSLSIDDVHKLFDNWDNLYTNKDIRGTFSIKDSVRDTYAVSLIHAFSDKIAKTTDPQALENLFNQHDEDTMAKVKKDMLALKEAAFGFECDSGKTDMVDQKVGANMCWSGDATWAIAEADKVDLYYSVPINNGKSASNIWFDGLCMPVTAKDEKHLTKEEKAQYALAEEFIKFMSRPDIAMLNCYCVGYTPAVAGEEMMDYMLWYYGVEDGEPSIEYDLSYFYDGTLSDTYKTANGFTSKIFINADPETAKRDLAAQYPTKEILPRLAVMKNFPEKDNIALLDMWEQVRTNPLPTWGVIVLVCEGAGALAFAIYLVSHKVNRKRFKKERHA
jgi:spermidine/putrescine transport system substrate-binding protein